MATVTFTIDPDYEENKDVETRMVVPSVNYSFEVPTDATYTDIQHHFFHWLKAIGYNVDSEIDYI